jgi:hypothetical protein
MELCKQTENKAERRRKKLERKTKEKLYTFKQS